MPPKISNMLVQSFSKVCAGMMELVDMTDSKNVMSKNTILLRY